MARDSEDKTEKKAKKAKRSATDGVTMVSKKQKKDKKVKKKLKKKLAEACDLDEKLQAAARVSARGKSNDDEDVSDSEEEETTGTITKIEPSLVPFAVPIADEKHGNKVLKCVRKCKSALSCCALRDAKTCCPPNSSSSLLTRELFFLMQQPRPRH